MIPDFIIAGAPKCGSTSLYHNIEAHPDICMSKPKEPNIFSIYWHERNHKLKKIYNHYKGEKLLGECSVGYFIHPKAPERIKSLNPDMKIIFILRNPIDRMYSHYWGRVRHSREFRQFSDAIRDDKLQYLYFYSFYHSNILNFLKVFPKENLHIIIFEEYINNQQNELNKLFAFLGLKEQHVELSEKKTNSGYKIRSKRIALLLKNLKREYLKNQSKTKLQAFLYKLVLYLGYKFNRSQHLPPISKEDRAYLKTIFYKDIQKLEVLLQRKLPWNF